MKNMIRISASYLTFALIAGVFYHEAAYYTHFEGVSVLRLVHGHALVLGALVFLAMPVLMKLFHIEQQKMFRRGLYTYNVGLIMSLFFMVARGVTQVFQMNIPSFADHMIGGLAGIGHVILTVGIFFFYRAYLNAVEK